MGGCPFFPLLKELTLKIRIFIVLDISWRLKIFLRISIDVVGSEKIEMNITQPGYSWHGFH